MALKHEKEHPMKPTRRMASIRTGCWCRGTAFPMSRKPFRLRSQSQPERIAEFPAGSSSISPAYITASFWLTPLSLYGALYGRHAGGQYPVPPSAFLREGSIVLWEQITTIDKRQCWQHLGSFDARQMDAIRCCIEISIGQAIPEREKTL